MNTVTKNVELLKYLKEISELDEYEKRAIVQMLMASNLVRALDRIGNEVFRPARKHGYSDEKINGVLDHLGNACPKEDEPSGETLVGLLEEKFFEILREEEVIDLIM